MDIKSKEVKKVIEIVLDLGRLKGINIINKIVKIIINAGIFSIIFLTLDLLLTTKNVIHPIAISQKRKGIKKYALLEILAG